jgi:hypothetical protein
MVALGGVGELRDDLRGARARDREENLPELDLRRDRPAQVRPADGDEAEERIDVNVCDARPAGIAGVSPRGASAAEREQRQKRKQRPGHRRAGVALRSAHGFLPLEAPGVLRESRRRARRDPRLRLEMRRGKAQNRWRHAARGGVAVAWRHSEQE